MNEQGKRRGSGKEEKKEKKAITHTKSHEQKKNVIKKERPQKEGNEKKTRFDVFCVCERKELEKRERVKEGWCDELCEQEAEQLFKVSGRHP